MSQQLFLSVVDQSPVKTGSTAGDALRETIELAAAVEEMGYHRYWVAEHHSLPNFAGTSPEVLIGHIAARTRKIRVGSGGVMLSHYSAFKVAENFRMLDSLHPGRIDLGIGRAPGSDQITAAALSFPKHPNEIRHFPRQVVDLLGYLRGEMEDGHIFSQIQAGPDREPQTAPDVWLLGSRYESAYMAAQLGLPFAYAHFFGIAVEEGPAICANYREHFQPSQYLSEPKINVGVHVICAETEEEAMRLAQPRNLARLQNITGRAKGIPSMEEALSYQYTPDEYRFMQQYAQVCVDGDPQQVKAGLEDIAEMYQTNDLSVVTICHDYNDRRRSYELLAEACGYSGERGEI